MTYLLHLAEAIAVWFRLNSKRGVTAIEYGLFAALIAVVLIGAVTYLGNNLSSLFYRIAYRV